MNWICLFLFCEALNTPIKQCSHALSQPTKEITDKMIDTIVAGGRAESVCGSESFVKNHEKYKAVMK